MLTFIFYITDALLSIEDLSDSSLSSLESPVTGSTSRTIPNPVRPQWSWSDSEPDNDDGANADDHVYDLEYEVASICTSDRNPIEDGNSTSDMDDMEQVNTQLTSNFMIKPTFSLNFYDTY